MNEIEVGFIVKKIQSHIEETGYSLVYARFIDCSSSEDMPKGDVLIAGYFSTIKVGDEFKAEGYWEDEKPFGKKFVLESYARILPKSEKGVMDFLMRYNDSLSPDMARRIFDAHGESSIEKTACDINNLLMIDSLGENIARNIHDRMKYLIQLDELALFSQTNGMGMRVAIKIFDKFGDCSIMKIRENPYSLCMIEGIGFPETDHVAKNLSNNNEDERRLIAAVECFVETMTSDGGHLFVTAEQISDGFFDFLMMNGAFKSEDKANMISQKAIDRAVGSLVSMQKLVVDGSSIYPERFFRVENMIARHLKRLLEAKREELCSKDEIERYILGLEVKGISLSEEQKEAVFQALTKRISIVAGGPGTGKTQTINFINQCILQNNSKAVIRQCAPTGKASKRLRELTGLEAKTIHQLIGLKESVWDREAVQVDGDFLVIDEASMIDAFLFYHLLSSVNDTTQILIVGDYEQLPSVGPGKILRDLIDSELVPVVKLKKIFRQAKDSQIVMNSHCLVNRDLDNLEFKRDGDFIFLDDDYEKSIGRRIVKCVHHYLKSGFNLSDIQVLSPKKVGVLGTISLNQIMQEEFNPPKKGEKWSERIKELGFREGDRVIQTANNYNLGVFNGDIGYVRSIKMNIDKSLNIEVEFDSARINFCQEDARCLELAYAITVHKSQGSEYPVVIMPIHSCHSEMLSKNLIYTAWTRAKKTLIVFGQKSCIYESIKRQETMSRNSRLSDRIKTLVCV